MINKDSAKDINEQLKPKSVKERIEWIFSNFGLDDFTFATSFGAEDQVLTDILLKENNSINIFTIDTGRLYQETYETMEAVIKRYNIKIEILFPNSEDLEAPLKEKGPNMFYRSIVDRKLCCRIRKILPLKRKLSGLKAWVCGLRSNQSDSRSKLNFIKWDENFNLYKISPLFDWSHEDVWNYIKEKKVPYNPLHDRGFPSIGCAPCTRSVTGNGQGREGRWWWGKKEKKECGLHL